MAYRNEMTIDEQIIHHSWESYYAACLACELHARAEEIKSRPSWPELGDEPLPLPVAVALAIKLPEAIDTSRKLGIAGFSMITTYQNLINESIASTARIWKVAA